MGLIISGGLYQEPEIIFMTQTKSPETVLEMWLKIIQKQILKVI